MISFGKTVTSLFSRPKPRQTLALSEPVDGEIKDVLELLNKDLSEKAFARLTQLKASAQPLRHTDYLRACIFLRRQQIPAAIQAVTEELRWFPDHPEGIALLRRLAPQVPVAPVSGDEFSRGFTAVRAYTMLSEARLHSLFNLASRACRENLPGNFVECGVAGGGSSALLAGVIAKHSPQSRILFSFDTFCGMPKSSALDIHEGQQAEDSGWGTGTCAAPESSLLEVCEKLGVRPFVRPVKGLFRDTLPAHRAQIGPIALLHMDGDWYSSTRDILENLFDQVVPGGYIQIDDYGYWEGCRRAVNEFAVQRGLTFQLTRIDETGVWLNKSRDCLSAAPGSDFLNLGCGEMFHRAWTNVDFRAFSPEVMAHDLRQPLPFADASFAAVYSSHLLEHFSRPCAPLFLAECRRLLKPGGILRLVVPDLETIAKLYLENLRGALAGDPKAAARHQWMTVELLDQMVREESGGEMLKYWMQDPLPEEEFILQRCGWEVSRFLQAHRARPQKKDPPGQDPPVRPSPAQITEFRETGEVHKWMYDRYSLPRLLESLGFTECKSCAAHESRIPNFNSYLLDLNQDGSVRKPDSLFIEAAKP
jgi:predicted SAM-dependent methyltransferase